MVLEIVRFDLKPGHEAEFDAAIAEGAKFFRRAKGCKSITLRKSVEHPSRRWFLLEWEKIEDHTVGFVQSADYPEFGKTIRPHAEKIEMEHTEVVHAPF